MNQAETIRPATYWEDMDWAQEHLAELYERYADGWIAISDQQVVAASPSLARVKRAAARLTGKSPEDITVKFIGREDVIYGARPFAL